MRSQPRSDDQRHATERARASLFRRYSPSCVGALALVCAACTSTPVHTDKVASSAYSTPLATTAGEAVGKLTSTHAAQCGFLVLDTGRDALRERTALIEAAERSIDLQYYIWNSDVTGRYLAQRLLAAAERGVHVRLLLDDVNTRGRDAVLAALDAQPLIEIRIYNPLPRGAWRWLDMLRDFSRINRRMHNKSLSIDGTATIIGGRNIGDEYFDASAKANVRDRDLLAVGPVVAAMGRAFDEFWNSEWAQPIAALATAQLTTDDRERRRTRAAEAAHELQQLGYELPEGASPALLHLHSLLRQLIWAPARLIVDRPPSQDELQRSDVAKPVALALRELAGGAQHEVLMESAYFIAGDPALELLAQLHARGVRLRALTNSLASNDLASNHSGYARRRVQMLRAGVELHELRPDADSCRALTANRCAQGALFGLHAKSVVFDRRIVYVGSFNLNLRSSFLNSETALIVDSTELAERIAVSIEENMRDDNSWHVAVAEDGSVRWQTTRNGRVEIDTHEPDTGFWRRFAVGFYRLWPIEKYL